MGERKVKRKEKSLGGRERMWFKNEFFLYNPMNSEVAYMQSHYSQDVKLFRFAYSNGTWI